MFLPLLQLIHHLQEEMCFGKVEDSCKFISNYNNDEDHTPTVTHTTHTLFFTPFSHIHAHTIHSQTHCHTFTHTNYFSYTFTQIHPHIVTHTLSYTVAHTQAHTHTLQ